MEKFYQFNPVPGGSKYVEMSREEFLEARNDPNRWFIYLGDYALEVEEAVYRDYYRIRNHSSYLLRDVDGHCAEILSLDEMEEEATYEMSVFSVHTELSTEEEVILRDDQTYRKQQLYAALAALGTDEAYVFVEMTLKKRKQKSLAAELTISQQAVSKKYWHALDKLRQLLKHLKR